MTTSRRTAPNLEWVQMYRQGIPTAKIAGMEGVAVTTVRYHLKIAAQGDPRIRDQHEAALPPRGATTNKVGLLNLEDVIAFYEAEGRTPTTYGKSPRERALGVWLLRRRQEAAQGHLSPTYRSGLAVIPGWDTPSTRTAENAARWLQRLEEVKALRAEGKSWPRHQKTDDVNERTLGVWLHVQRIDYRKGRLDPAKESKLNELLPGWREGRTRGGGRRRTAPG